MKRLRQADPTRYAIIVLDDVIGENFNQKWYKRFIATNRHYGIITLIGIQHLKSLSPTIRDNIQKVFLTGSNNATLHSLYELSTEDNEWLFRKKCKHGLRVGNPTFLDFRPGQREIVHLEVEYTPTL